MKKILYLLLAGTLFAACNSKKNDNGGKAGNRPADDYRNTVGGNENKDETASWSSADVKSFNEQCLQTLKNNEELAGKLCPCLLEKMEHKYSSMAEMDKNSTEEEGKTAAEDCMKKLNISQPSNTDVAEGGSWPDSEREAFMTECVKSAMKNGVTRTKATNYCSCMQENLERMHPDVNELSNLSESRIEEIMKPYKDKCLQDQ